MVEIITGDAYGSDMKFTQELYRNYRVHNMSLKPYTRMKGINIMIDDFDGIADKFHLVRSYLNIPDVYDNYERKLLMKCYHQVKDSNLVFLIGKMDKTNRVRGMAGYQLYYAMDYTEAEIFFYDQFEKCWYKANRFKKGFRFDRLGSRLPYKELFQKYSVMDKLRITCSGTRDLNVFGNRAISHVTEIVKKFKYY